MQIYGWKPLAVIQHLTIFDEIWFCTSGNLTFLICHMIEGWCNFVDGSTSLYVTTPLSSVAIGIVVVEMFLVVQDQDSTCSLNSIIRIYPYSTWHESIYHAMYKTGHTRLEQQ